MKQEIEYRCPTAEELHRMLENCEKMDYWEQIGELCEKYEYPTILEWKEKADKYDEIMAKRKKASEKSKASLMKNMTAEERRERAIKANKASQEKRRKK